MRFPYRNIIEKGLVEDKELLGEMGIYDLALDSLENTSFEESIFIINGKPPTRTEVSASYEPYHDGLHFSVLNPEVSFQVDTSLKERLVNSYVHEIIHKNSLEYLDNFRGDKQIFSEGWGKLKKHLDEKGILEKLTQFWEIYRSPDTALVNIKLHEENEFQSEGIFVAVGFAMGFNPLGNRESWRLSVDGAKQIWDDYCLEQTQENFVRIYNREMTELKGAVKSFIDKTYSRLITSSQQT